MASYLLTNQAQPATEERLYLAGIPFHSLRCFFVWTNCPQEPYAMDFPDEFKDGLLLNYSDSELTRRILASPKLTEHTRLRLLSDNLISKHYDAECIDDEIKATETAHHLGIPVPSVKRIVTVGVDAYCIMERAAGKTLEEQWPSLSWWSSMTIAMKLRRYVQQLRSLTSSGAGSLVSGGCRSFWLEDRFGLPVRCSSEDITNFIRFWVGFKSIRKAMLEAKNPSEQAELSKAYIPARTAFVFTHHDLAPRNILVDAEGQLCILDWELSGFYPVYFEYAGMMNFLFPENWGWFARLRWRLLAWMVAGRWERQRHVLENVRSKFSRFSLGRRFAIMHNKSRRKAT